MACNFNCSAPTPALSENSDITGIGIIINNIVTAGFTVVVILLHYIAIYDPTREPFQKHGQTPATSFRPNPIDESILNGLRLILSHVPFVNNGRQKRADFLLKCIRELSDIQIVTGFSILVSGFLQLRCGLSTYHWQVVVHLGWLSCLTQFSCLTLLRNHLHDHPTERVFRLLAVGVSVILLIVGLSFTGNYHWAFGADNDDHPTLSDPAICYMRPHPGINSAFLSMPYMMILMIFGFASRVINLYDTLSVGVVGRARTFLARPIRRLMHIAYDWSDVNDWRNVSNWSGASGSPRSLKLVLCYLPLLSVYFTCLVLVDVWDSAATEVGWLTIAFVCGISRMIRTIYRPEQIGLEASLTGFNDWSFGQVASVVLLAAPLITVIEYIQEEDEPRGQDETPPKDETPAKDETGTQDEIRVQDQTPTQDQTRPKDETRSEDDEQPLSNGDTVPLPELASTRAEDETHVQDRSQTLSDGQFIPPLEPRSIADPTTVDLNVPHNDWVSHLKISDLISVHIGRLAFAVILWAAQGDPFANTTTILLDAFLFAGLWMFVLILCSLMVETAFADRRPNATLFLEQAVRLYSIGFMSVSLPIWAKLVYCLLPLPIIGVLAYRFWC
ncbi:uncharacterized protein N7487_004791 [Penicillium crustosum]|uniref:uncharacterized protein n=1 Tax=Penicillium crustosum TaxID=36656 RepID=UPI002390FE4F|nr:uncharacterized protein N7487_004791 [Penicillium crustosum]KAJ5410432.1 hypothetical protein N7487_004791 [Penicillium crustosum]